MVINKNNHGEHIPYCICYYNGKEKHSFYLTDYSDHFDMMQAVLLSLFKKKYSGYVIYAYNLSNFDGIFLLNALTKIENIKISPILKDGDMFNIKINYGAKFKNNISFRDSLLLLPQSLKDLSIQFKVPHIKTSFPHSFLNESYNKNIDLNYVGNIPDQIFFGGHNKYSEYISEYNNNISENNYSPSQWITSLSNWNLRNEAIRYCVNDCVCLIWILIKLFETKLYL